MQFYWFRTDRGVPGPAVAADPRLTEVAAALSAGQLAQCRELAQAVLDSADDHDLRAEASSYLVESHLAEGDFAGARAAAKRTGDTESLARVNKLEAAYNAEVNRLQRIVATTQDTELAAWAQLRTADTHRQIGRWEQAELSYWKLVQRYPEERWAGKAVVCLADMRWQRGDPDGAVALCQQVADLAPDSEAAAGACYALSRPHLVGAYSASATQRLRQVATAHPGTWAADMALYGIGAIHLAEGDPAAAENEWAALVVTRSGVMDRELERQVRGELANVRYERAMAAVSRGDLEAAIEAMELAVSEPVWGRSLQGPLFLLGNWYERLSRQDDAIRVRSRLLSLSQTKDDQLGTKMRIAVSLRKAGRAEEAIELLQSILQEAPPEYLAQQCRGEIELVRNPPELTDEDESSSVRAPE
ncbi:MAG: tetratricopeptide repeat protein [Armatimonadota bacterium]